MAYFGMFSVPNLINILIYEANTATINKKIINKYKNIYKKM